MKKTQNNQAFTLIELIVVITILAILGTIAFISLQGYSAQARDSKRLSDVQNIKKSLELFSLNTGKYPLADDYITVSYSGETLRYQGTVGNQVTTNLSRNLNEKPLDPSTETEYTYSTTHSQTEYEVLGLYESDLISTSPQPSPLSGEGVAQILIKQSNAATQDYPKIDGNYNGIYIKTSNFYVPTPSIINAEIVSNDNLDSTLIKSQIITGGDNIPLTSTGELNVNFSFYNGTITKDSTDEEKEALVTAIQTAYNGSDLASNTMYADILSKTSTEEMLDFVDTVILNKTEYKNTSGLTNIIELPGWDYQTTVDITESSGRDLTDYQISFEIDTKTLIDSSKLLSNCDDLRFINSDNESISFWVQNETCNTNNTIVWIKTDLQAYQTKTIYMFYGNSSAENIENGDDVFLLFDDFNGTAIDTTKWSSNNISVFSVSNSWANCNGTDYQNLRSINNIDSTEIIIEQRLNIISATTNYNAYQNAYIGSSGTDSLNWYYESENRDRYICLNSSCGWKPGIEVGIRIGISHLKTIKRDGSLQMISSGKVNFDTTWTGTTNNESKQIGIFGGKSSVVKADYIFVRKY